MDHISLNYRLWGAFWPKSQTLTFGIRWILHCETLIFDFWGMHSLGKLGTCEWTLGVPLSVLNYVLEHWLNLRWKFPPGGFSQSKTLIWTAEVLEIQLSCTCAIFCLIFVHRTSLILVATLKVLRIMSIFDWSFAWMLRKNLIVWTQLNKHFILFFKDELVMHK